jgi:hypothetical protein
LTLTPSTNRPRVGKDVIVVAALEPAQTGARYKLNWGDGSPVETVSDSGTHHYAKAKLYKVSASAVVGETELNHEIVLNVTPSIWPPLALGLLAMMAALVIAQIPPPIPAHLTMIPRLGTPGVPQMTLLGREPYASLSFEPGVKPAEERISFFKKRRKSRSEQS